MATTVYEVWNREERCQWGGHGTTYPDVTTANAVIARLKKKSGQLPGESGTRTYDVVAVTVP
jgi:hypothetical protein